MEKNDLKKTINTHYTEALMTEIPFILVEGKDDVPFYSRLCDKIGKERKVFPVDAIAEYNGHSCDDVINAVLKIENAAKNKEECQRFLLGIIDRDTRFFRGSLPESNCILVLKYYSFESHLINTNNIKVLLEKNTYMKPEYLEKELLDEFLELEDEVFELFYYAGLDAMKNACETEYQSIVSYDKKAEEILKNKNIKTKLEQRKNELKEFAEKKKIEYDAESFKKIVKGHWYLWLYADSIKKKMEKLPRRCKNGEIKQCTYCMIKEWKKCLYNERIKIQINNIENSLITNYDYSDVGYIWDRIEKLG